jgi:hypothetical protein
MYSRGRFSPGGTSSAGRGRAENGEIIGVPTENGGWLVLDNSYQVIGVYHQFRYAEGGKAGVLLRAEKTADGLKGVLVSLAGGEAGVYQVVLDAQGKETSHAKLDAGPGPMIRMSGAGSAEARTWCPASPSPHRREPNSRRPQPKLPRRVAEAAVEAVAVVAVDRH